MLTGLWDNENPAREFLLARRVYVIGSKVVWLVEEIPAREFLLARRVYVCYNQVELITQAMIIRLVSFYWPAECT